MSINVFGFAGKRKVLGLTGLLEELGHHFLTVVHWVGGISLLLARAVRTFFTTPLRTALTIDQMNKIGVNSLPLVFLTSLFTGMVLALQSAYQLQKFSAMKFTADLVSLSVTRELGPVLTAIVVAGRIGAAMTAEIGTMRVTEQIDALQSLGVDPVRYLVVPRLVAGVGMLLVLSMYSDFIGMLGGYLVAVFKLGLSSDVYIKRTFDALMLKDIWTGLFKATVFGLIISIVGCYFGFQTRGGAEGVGRATTMSVVASLVGIIVMDCFFTAFFYFVL